MSAMLHHHQVLHFTVQLSGVKAWSKVSFYMSTKNDIVTKYYKVDTVTL